MNPDDIFLEEIRGEDIISDNTHCGIQVIRTKNCICMRFSGVTLVSKPVISGDLQGGALYQMLKIISDHLDHKADKDQSQVSTYDKEDEKDMDDLTDIALSTLTLPVDMFADPLFFLDVANYILNRRTELYRQAHLEQHESDAERIIKDEIFQKSIEEVEALKQSHKQDKKTQ